MKTKDGVVLELSYNMRKVLEKIELACKLIEGNSYEMTITSAKDGIHMKNSLHYSGNAIDIRIKDMNYPCTCKDVIKSVLSCRCYGNCYDVVLEKDHIHIEYDTNK